jgi:hypothetical protein
MIAKCFSSFPHMLWITLWASWVAARQVLDSTGLCCNCLIRQQGARLNKIKDLATIRGNPDGRRACHPAFAVQHDFWG